MASFLGKSRSFSVAEGDAKFGQCVKPRRSCISGFFNIFANALPSSKHSNKNSRQKWLHHQEEQAVLRVENGRGQDEKQVQKSHGGGKGSLSETDCKNAKEQCQQVSHVEIGGSHNLNQAWESHGKGSGAVNKKNVSVRMDVDKVERDFKSIAALPDNSSKTKELYARSSGNAMVEPSWVSVDSGTFRHCSGFCEVQEQPSRLSLDGRMEDDFTEGGHSGSSNDDLQPFFSAGSGHKGGGDGDSSTPFSSPSSFFRSFEYAKNSAFLKRFQDFNRGINNATVSLDQSRDTHNSFHSSLHSDGINTIMPTQWHSIDVIADTPRFSFPLDNHYHPHHHHHHRRHRRHNRHHHRHNRQHRDMELEGYGVRQRTPSFSYKDALRFFKRGGDLSFDRRDARSKPISDNCFTQSLNLDSSSRYMLMESKLPNKPLNVAACLMGLDDDGKERENRPFLSSGKNSPKPPSKEGSLFQRKLINKKEEASWPWFEQGYSSDGYSLSSPVLMKDSLLRCKETLLIPSDLLSAPSSPSATIAKHLPRRNISEKHFMDNIRRSSSCPRRRYQERRQQQMAMAELYSEKPSHCSTKGTIVNPFEDEIEKRLRQLGLQSSQTECKTLKQILEAMHVKGLLHQLPSKKDDNPNPNSNSNLDSNPNPNPNFDSNPNPNPDPNPSQDIALVVPSRSSKQVMAMESVFFTPPNYSEIGDMEVEKQAVRFRLDHPAMNENSREETKAASSSSSIVIMKPRSKVHGEDWERRARVVDPLSNRVGLNSTGPSIEILPCYEHDERVLKYTLAGDTSNDVMLTKNTSSDALLLPKGEIANNSIFKARVDLESGIDQVEEEEVKYVICSEVVAVDHPVESSVDYHHEGQKLHPPLLKRKVESIVRDTEMEMEHRRSTELAQAMEDNGDLSLETNIKLHIGHCQEMESTCGRVLGDGEGEDGNYGAEFEYVRDIFVNSRLLRGAMVGEGGRGDDDDYYNHHQGEPICPDLYLTLEKKWECAQDEALETHERANDLDFGGELYVKSLQEALQRRLLFECVEELLSKQWPPRPSEVTQNLLLQSSSSSSSHITLKDIWSNLQRILPSSPVPLSPPLRGKLGRDDIHTILVKDMAYWWLDPWNNMDATRSSQAFHMAKNIESSIFTDLIEEVLFDLHLY